MSRSVRIPTRRREASLSTMGMEPTSWVFIISAHCSTVSDATQQAGSFVITSLDFIIEFSFWARVKKYPYHHYPSGVVRLPGSGPVRYNPATTEGGTQVKKRFMVPSLTPFGG